jgi:hypothetical protein
MDNLSRLYSNNINQLETWFSRPIGFSKETLLSEKGDHFVKVIELDDKGEVVCEVLEEAMRNDSNCSFEEFLLYVWLVDVRSHVLISVVTCFLHWEHDPNGLVECYVHPMYLLIHLGLPQGQYLIQNKTQEIDHALHGPLQTTQIQKHNEDMTCFQKQHGIIPYSPPILFDMIGCCGECHHYQNWKH